MRAGAAIAVLVMCCGLVPMGAQAAGPTAARRSKLASADWSVSASPNLANNPPMIKTVQSFVRGVEISIRGDSALGEGGESLCSFRFADLRHDGFLSLVAGFGSTDSLSSCRGIYIVDKTASGFAMRSTDGAVGTGADVADNIRDLGHDGNLELLVYINMAATIGAQCGADWTAIYAWTGGNYTNVSEQFKDFYRQRLDSLNKTIAHLQATSRPGEYDGKECPEAEAAAIQRFLGISSDAGIDQAIRMADSKDRLERQFAAQILGVIGTAKARKYLATLAKDSDTSVAFWAKTNLSELSKGSRWTVPNAFSLLQPEDKF